VSVATAMPIANTVNLLVISTLPLSALAIRSSTSENLPSETV
jgi:hypothetical protein